MNDDAAILAFLRKLAEDTARELWKVARRETTDSRLVLPNYTNGKLRVSEQEARSITQRLVSQSPYFFSIETPTPGAHRFRVMPRGQADPRNMISASTRRRIHRTWSRMRSSSKDTALEKAGSRSFPRT